MRRHAISHKEIQLIDRKYVQSQHRIDTQFWWIKWCNWLNTVAHATLVILATQIFWALNALNNRFI